MATYANSAPTRMAALLTTHSALSLTDLATRLATDRRHVSICARRLSNRGMQVYSWRIGRETFYSLTPKPVNDPVRPLASLVPIAEIARQWSYVYWLENQVWRCQHCGSSDWMGAGIDGDIRCVSPECMYARARNRVTTEKRVVA